MSYSSRRAGAGLSIAAAILGLAAGCSSKRPQPPERRVAVLPLENLTGDASFDWVGRAVSGIAAARASGDAGARAFAAPALREAQTARATQVLEGYLTREASGVRVYATLRDEGTRRDVKTVVATGTAADTFRMAEQVASQLDAPLRPYTTTNLEAVRELFSDQPEKALAADSGFGAAHMRRIELLLSAGKREEAAKAIQAARASRLNPFESARLDLVAAQMSGNREAQAAALAKIAASDAVDLQVWRGLGSLYMSLKKYKSAADAYARALELSPNDQELLNTRGYACAYAGEFEEARRTLERYGQAAPNSANPLDSLAEVNFLFGHFADAERLFLQAHEKDPNALGGFEPFRAALSRYLAGDHAAADAAVTRFLDRRAKAGDDAAGVRRLVWFRLTGRPAEFTGQQSAMLSAASLWALYDGDRPRALSSASAARHSAAMPEAVNRAIVAELLAQPSADVRTWRDRVEKALPGPQQVSIRRQVLGLALLFDGKFEGALPVVRENYDANAGLAINDERIALAWALSGAGRESEARAFVGPGFLPPQALDPGVSTVLYAKALDLRAKYRHAGGQ